MEEQLGEPGKHIIEEGADGDCIYVVESGDLDCTKVIGGEKKQLKTYGHNDVFGELALLYNCQRAATITAKTACKLWKLDRDAFNHIVKDSARKQRERYENFLASVPLLKNLDPYERGILCDAFTESFYEPGDYIIKEGEEGNLFYLIEKGTCKATKILGEEKKETDVKQYAEHEYFGERALLKGEARAASVVATSKVQLAEMDKEVF
jgi:cAMP-dependent protein kinase regulator